MVGEAGAVCEIPGDVRVESELVLSFSEFCDNNISPEIQTATFTKDYPIVSNMRKDHEILENIVPAST